MSIKITYFQCFCFVKCNAVFPNCQSQLHTYVTFKSLLNPASLFTLTELWKLLHIVLISSQFWSESRSVAKMNVLLVIQITVYILALVLALCISVPVIIHQKDFKYFLISFTLSQRNTH